MSAHPRTSYDRYWEGRKAFATITSNIRNFSRQIWINVALPPPETAARYPAPVTPTQLHRYKIDALHLALSFAFAVKHYLRGEDGINYPDYHGVLPASFARYDETGYNTLTNRFRQSTLYDATVSNDSRDLNAAPSGRASPESSATKPNATKRVKAKRSKRNLTDPSPITPLLAGSHRTVEFHAYAADASLPLPLMYEFLLVSSFFNLIFSSRIAHELSRLVFQFRREGFLETVGPAGANGLSQLYIFSILHVPRY